MKRQERRRADRASARPPAEPFVPMHDLEAARERYYDLVKQRGLSPEDIHAIMMGGTSDAVLTFIQQQWPTAPNPLAILQSDFDTLRRGSRHTEEAFAGALLLGWLMLLTTATVTPGEATQ